MFYLLLTLLILDALLLSVVVLLQAGQGGGLAGLGGATTDTVLGGRQAVTILTKLSWWCGGIFLALSLLLSLVPRSSSGSALQERLRSTAPPAPVPQLPLTQQAPAPVTPQAPAPVTQQAPAPAPQPQSQTQPKPKPKQ